MDAGAGADADADADVGLPVVVELVVGFGFELELAEFKLSLDDVAEEAEFAPVVVLAAGAVESLMLSKCAALSWTKEAQPDNGAGLFLCH